MSSAADVHLDYQPWPRLWRLVLVALSTLILCSCRGPAAPQGPMGPGAACGTLPPAAFAGGPGSPMGAPGAMPGMPGGPPLPYSPTGPWAPPGIVQPWPADEYLADGGHDGPPLAVDRDWHVRGMEAEDAVAHFDTVDGRTIVEPSNRVYVYSPRFGAVRQVVNITQEEQVNGSVGVVQPLSLIAQKEVQRANLNSQNLQAARDISAKRLTINRGRQGQGIDTNVVGPIEFSNGFRAYEDFEIIRLGQFKKAEMAALAKRTAAATIWTNNQAVQVLLDRKSANEDVTNEKVASVFSVDLPPGNPKLRVVKVASTQMAEPGETIDFTLRFDNVGNQVIGNVTLLDSLSGRLEYVPESAQSSVKANFSTQPNESGSLVLRWEIVDPVAVGHGGVVRFTCKVR
jgi:uncharacterized repeat protein (TIGR01451 family)